MTPRRPRARGRCGTRRLTRPGWSMLAVWAGEDRDGLASAAPPPAIAFAAGGRRDAMGWQGRKENGTDATCLCAVGLRPCARPATWAATTAGGSLARGPRDVLCWAMGVAKKKSSRGPCGDFGVSSNGLFVHGPFSRLFVHGPRARCDMIFWPIYLACGLRHLVSCVRVPNAAAHASSWYVFNLFFSFSFFLFLFLKVNFILTFFFHFWWNNFFSSWNCEGKTN
jgi:hypothetical protein